MAMVARALEKRDTERDTSPPLTPKGTPEAGKTIPGMELPDPAKDPKWDGISVEMAKEFGEADPANKSPLPKGSRQPAVCPVDEMPIKLSIPLPVEAPALPSLAEALSTDLSAVTVADGTAATFSHLKKQIEGLQALLKQEHDERMMTEAIAKELTGENRTLRDELAKASVVAATSKAALDAREELLAHLKEEVSELRAVAFKRV